MRRRIHTCARQKTDVSVLYEEEDTCMSYEEEDTFMSYEEEDTCMSYEEEYNNLSLVGCSFLLFTALLVYLLLVSYVALLSRSS